jgi:hypothetical protein
MGINFMKSFLPSSRVALSFAKQKADKWRVFFNFRGQKWNRSHAIFVINLSQKATSFSEEIAA